MDEVVDTETPAGISPVQDIVNELRAGRVVILVDDEDRENEGDMMLAADFVTPESINFMATHARGLICLTLTAERCAQLGLELMSTNNSSRYGTAFTTSIEAAEGVTISWRCGKETYRAIPPEGLTVHLPPDALLLLKE